MIFDGLIFDKKNVALHAFFVKLQIKRRGIGAAFCVARQISGNGAGAAMAAGLSRIRDVFRFYSRVFCFAAEEFFLPHGLGRQAPVAAGETFFRVHGSWRVCPAGLFRTGASSACSGDGCFAGGGERAWRLNKKRRRRCACTVSGDGSDRRKKRFFCRRVFVQNGIRPAS